MVRVKEKGNFSLKEWRVDKTCESDDEHDKRTPCGAVLSVKAKDLSLRYWKGSHFNHFYTVVRCPLCGKVNRVRNVPDLVVEKTRTPRNMEQAEFDGFSDRH